MTHLVPHLDHRLAALTDEAARRRLAADRPARGTGRREAIRLRLEGAMAIGIAAVIAAVVLQGA